MPNAPIPAAAPGLPATPTSINPDALPDGYGLVLVGDCMAPLLPDGATVICSRSASYEPGDLVVLWFRPELVKPGHEQCRLKRLVIGPPRSLKFPHRDTPESEALPVVVVEMLNPPGRMVIRCAHLLAIHKVLGAVPAGKGRRVSAAELRAVATKNASSNEGADTQIAPRDLGALAGRLARRCLNGAVRLAPWLAE